MQGVAQPGARVLVPVGSKLTTGYIVGLHDKLKEGSSLAESEIKEAEELLDVVPLITPEVLQLTRWVSDYYASPWGEVLKAALPPGISASIEQLLSVTQKGREELASSQSKRAVTNKVRLLRMVAEEGEMTL